MSKDQTVTMDTVLVRETDRAYMVMGGTWFPKSVTKINHEVEQRTIPRFQNDPKGKRGMITVRVCNITIPKWLVSR